MSVIWEHLAEANVYQNSHLQKNFWCILWDVGGMESDWAMLNNSIETGGNSSDGTEGILCLLWEPMFGGFIQLVGHTGVDPEYPG